MQEKIDCLIQITDFNQFKQEVDKWASQANEDELCNLADSLSYKEPRQRYVVRLIAQRLAN